MANGRAESVGIQNIDESRKALDLDFSFRIPRHVGSSKMREHSLELEVLERKRRTDVVEVLSVKAVTVHARVNRKMRLAGRTGFAKELVKSHRCAEVGNRRRELEFDEIGEVCGSAGTEHKNRQVHAILAQQHALTDVSDTQIVCTTKLGGKRAGEASVSVGIRLHGEQNLCRSGNLASNESNVVAESV